MPRSYSQLLRADRVFHATRQWILSISILGSVGVIAALGAVCYFNLRNPSDKGATATGGSSGGAGIHGGMGLWAQPSGKYTTVDASGFGHVSFMAGSGQAAPGPAAGGSGIEVPPEFSSWNGNQIPVDFSLADTNRSVGNQLATLNGDPAVMSQFGGAGFSSPGVVPEPGTLSLAILGGTIMAWRTGRFRPACLRRVAPVRESRGSGPGKDSAGARTS